MKTCPSFYSNGIITVNISKSLFRDAQYICCNIYIHCYLLELWVIWPVETTTCRPY